MGRRAKGPAVFGRWHTPKALGNAEDAEPVRVQLRVTQETADLISGCASDMRGGRSGQDGLRWMREVCRLAVVGVEGYDKPDGVPMKTGDDFATHAELELIEDVWSEVMRTIGLAPPEAVGSGGSSESSEPGTGA